jgi:hypothetical protein
MSTLSISKITTPAVHAVAVAEKKLESALSALVSKVSSLFNKAFNAVKYYFLAKTWEKNAVSKKLAIESMLAAHSKNACLVQLNPTLAGRESYRKVEFTRPVALRHVSDEQKNIGYDFVNHIQRDEMKGLSASCKAIATNNAFQQKQAEQKAQVDEEILMLQLPF